MKEIGEEVACGQVRSGVPGTLTQVSTGLDTYIHKNIYANIHYVRTTSSSLLVL